MALNSTKKGVGLVATLVTAAAIGMGVSGCQFDYHRKRVQPPQHQYRQEQDYGGPRTSNPRFPVEGMQTKPVITNDRPVESAPYLGNSVPYEPTLAPVLELEQVPEQAPAIPEPSRKLEPLPEKLESNTPPGPLMIVPERVA